MFVSTHFFHRNRLDEVRPQMTHCNGLEGTRPHMTQNGLKRTRPHMTGTMERFQGFGA